MGIYRVVGGKVTRARLVRMVEGKRALSRLGRVMPAPTVDPIPNPAMPKMAVGVNVHPLWSDYTVARLDRMANAGVTTVRADFGWSDIQPNNKNAFDGYRITGVMDPFFAACRARGIKVLAMLYKPPFWSSGAGTAANPAKNGIPANPADYGVVLKWFVQRYAADLIGVEMFNEMDIATFSATRSPADYVALMKAGYAAAKGLGVPLIAGAPTYLGLATSWFANCYAVGGGGANGFASGTGDYVAVHPYMSPSNLAPDQNSSGSGRKWSIVGIDDVKALMAANGDTRGIWATEFGWSAHGNTGSEENYQRGVTDAQQAQYLTGAYALMDSLGVKAAYWYDDHRLSSGDAQEANFGLTYTDGSATPALTALASYISGAPAPFVGKKNNLSGIATGTAITPGNSGGSSGDAFGLTTGTVTAQDSSDLTGVSGDRGFVASTSASTNSYVAWTHDDYSGGGWVRLYIRRSVATSFGIRVARGIGSNGTSIQWEARWQSDGSILIANQGGATLCSIPGLSALNQAYRLEFNPYTKEVRAYTGDGNTLTGTATVYDATVPTAGAWVQTRYGLMLTSAQTASVEIAAPAVSPNGPIGLAA